jgi:hypothetical protein
VLWTPLKFLHRLRVSLAVQGGPSTPQRLLVAFKVALR